MLETGATARIRIPSAKMPVPSAAETTRVRLVSVATRESVCPAAPHAVTWPLVSGLVD